MNKSEGASTIKPISRKDVIKAPPEEKPILFTRIKGPSNASQRIGSLKTSYTQLELSKLCATPRSAAERAL